MKQKEMIELALTKTQEQRSQCPADPLLVLIESQLKYVRKVLQGKRPSRMRLSRINIAAFASLTDRDPSYVNLLEQSQTVAEKLRPWAIGKESFGS